MEQSGFFDKIEENDDLEVCNFSNELSKEIKMGSLLRELTPRKIKGSNTLIMDRIPTSDNFLISVYRR